MRVIYIAPKNVKQTHRRSHCTSAKRMNNILRHVAEAFPPARQGTILNSHRVIGIATNTLMVLNCALVNECSLPSYPGQRDPQTPHSVGLHERYLTNQLPTSLAYSEGLLS